MYSFKRSFIKKIAPVFVMSLILIGCSPDEEPVEVVSNNANQNNQVSPLIGRWVSYYSTGVRYKTFYDNGTMTQESIDESDGTSTISVQYSYDEVNQIVFLIGIGRPITWHSATSFSLGSPFTEEDELHTKVN
jgi:hypothetical protein